MSYLCAVRWRRYDIAAQTASRAAAGVLRSNFSAFWNPETDRGQGARPETWAAVGAAATTLVDDAEVNQP